MKLFVFALLFTIIVPAWALAQEVDFMKMMRSQRNREYHKDFSRERYHALWNGNGALVSSTPLWRDEEFRQELNFTPEQREQIDFLYSRDGGMGHWYRTKAQTDPVLAQMLAEHDPINEEMRNDLYGENTPPEKERAYLDGLRKLSAYYLAESQRDIENALTPEQMRKIREAELALMSEIPILNPAMFYSLDLTGQQKEQMYEIKKMLEPVFEQIVEELVEAEDAVQQLRFDMIEKIGIRFDAFGQLTDEHGNSLMNDREAAEKKFNELENEWTKNAEFQAKMKRINDSASGFMRDFKFKIYDILTDDQLVRMQHVINHPTPHVKALRDRLQKERAERARNDWQPGMDSWRPGDPIPAQYLEQRRQRGGFPRPESSRQD